MRYFVRYKTLDGLVSRLEEMKDQPSARYLIRITKTPMPVAEADIPESSLGVRQYQQRNVRTLPGRVIYDYEEI